MPQLLWPLSLAALLSMPVGVLARAPGIQPDLQLNAPSRFQALDERANGATGILTYGKALELALRASPEIAAAKRELEAVNGSVRQAGVLPNPELAATVEDTRYSQTRTTTVQINQLLETGGKRNARISAAERARDQASVELQSKQSEVRAAVATAFYDVLNMQERLRLAHAAADLARRSVTIASKRVAAGKVSPVEETKARVAESSVRIESAQAESELISARNRLAALWGARQAQFEKLEGGFHDLPRVPGEWNELLSRLDTSPNLVRAKIEVERRKALAKVEQARRIPDVTLSFGAKRDEEIGRTQAVVGLSVPLPFFDRNQGNLQEALSRAYKAEDELAATQVRLENELSQSYQRLKTTRREAELYQKEILPGAQSAYDAATKGFEYGKFGFLDVLDAQRTLFQATSQYLRALSEAHRAAADVDRILGYAESANEQVKP